jgi:hypothetical protein
MLIRPSSGLPPSGRGVAGVGRRLSDAPRKVLLPAAAGGLVAGHFFTYVFLAPAGSHRAMLLSHTGHAYFPRAIAAAAALGAIAMGAAAARGVARRHAGARTYGWRALAIRMAIVQAAGFVALEIVERMIVDAPLAGMAAVLPVGFAVEVLVAASVAALLCLTVVAAETVVRVLAKRPERRTSVDAVRVSARADDFHRILELLSSSVSLRGPPEPSVA